MFPRTCYEQPENEFKKSSPFIIASKRVRHLGTNVAKEAQISYSAKKCD
jgi:hypothetical protein